MEQLLKFIDQSILEKLLESPFHYYTEDLLNIISFINNATSDNGTFLKSKIYELKNYLSKLNNEELVDLVYSKLTEAKDKFIETLNNLAYTSLFPISTDSIEKFLDRIHALNDPNLEKVLDLLNDLNTSLYNSFNNSELLNLIIPPLKEQYNKFKDKTTEEVAYELIKVFNDIAPIVTQRIIKYIDKKIIEEKQDLLEKAKSLADFVEDIKDIFKGVNFTNLKDQEANGILEKIEKALSLLNYTEIIETLLKPYNETNYVIIKQMEELGLLDEFKEFVANISQIPLALKIVDKNINDYLYAIYFNISKTDAHVYVSKFEDTLDEYHKDIIDFLKDITDEGKILNSTKLNETITNKTKEIIAQLHNLNSTTIDNILIILKNLEKKIKEKIDENEFVIRIKLYVDTFLRFYKIEDNKDVPIEEYIYAVIEYFKSMILNEEMNVIEDIDDSLTDGINDIAIKLYDLADFIEQVKKKLNGTALGELLKFQKNLGINITNYLLNKIMELNFTITKEPLNDKILEALNGTDLLDDYKEFISQLETLEKYFDKLLHDEDGKLLNETVYNLTNLLDNINVKSLIKGFTNSLNNTRDMFIKNLVEVLTQIHNAQILLKDSNSTEIVDLSHAFLKNITDYIKENVHTLNNTILNYITDRLFDINGDMFNKLNNTEAIDKFHKAVMEIIDSFKCTVDNIELRKATLDEIIYNIIQEILDWNSTLVIDSVEETLDTNREKLINKLTEMNDYLLNVEELIENLNGTELVKLQEGYIKKLSDKLANYSYSFNSTIVNETFELLFELNNLLKDKLNETGAVDKFKEYLVDLIEMGKESKVNYLLFQNRVQTIKNLIGNFFQALVDYNSILMIHSEIDSFREEFIKNISDFEYLQSIVDQIKDQIDLALFPPNSLLGNLYDILKNQSEAVNETIFNYIEMIKGVNEDLKDKFNQTGIPSFIEDVFSKFNDFEEIIKNLTDFDIKPLNETFNDFMDRLSNSNLTKFIVDLNASIYNCDLDSFEKLLHIDEIKDEYDVIKKLFEEGNSTKIVKEKNDFIKESLEKMKEKAESLKEDPLFEPILTGVDNIKDKIVETMIKMNIYNNFTNFVEYVDSIVDILSSVEDNFEILLLNSYFKVQDNIEDLNISQKKEEFEEFLEDLGKEIEKIKSIDKLSEKVKYILTNLDDYNDDKRDEFRDYLDNLKKQAESLNSTLLGMLIDKLSEVNDQIDDYSKKNAQDYIDDIVKGIKQLEKDYENAEDLLDDQKQKLLNDLEVINTTILERILCLSHNNTGKVIEYLDLIDKIIDYYENLPKDTNIDEVYNKHKDVLLDELDELQDNSKDIIDGTYIGDIFDNIKNLQDQINEQLDGSSLDDYFKNLISNADGIEDSIKNMTINNGIILKEIVERIMNRISKFNLTEINNLENFLDQLQTSSILDGDKLENAINRLNILNNLIDTEEVKENAKNLTQKMKELEELLKKLSQNESLKSLIKKILENSEDMNILDLISEVRKNNKDFEQDIIDILKIKFLVDDIKEILNNSFLAKLINGIISQNRRRRVLFATLKKLRNLQQEGKITCKFDQTFTDADVLRPEQINMNNYVLSNEDYNISINDDMRLIINGDEQNCTDNEIDKVKSSFVYTYYDNFTVESSKERVNYKLHAKKVGDYTIPSSFFYLLLKLKLSEITSDTTVDGSQEVDSYCVINDTSNSNDIIFNCYAYTGSVYNIDNVDGISEVNSSYITVSTNSTDIETDSYNNNGINSFKRSNSKKLKAGAIVAIVLACVVVLAAIIGIIMCAKSRASVKAPFEVSDSHNNLSLPNSYAATNNYPNNNLPNPHIAPNPNALANPNN